MSSIYGALLSSGDDVFCLERETKLHEAGPPQESDVHLAPWPLLKQLYRLADKPLLHFGWARLGRGREPRLLAKVCWNRPCRAGLDENVCNRLVSISPHPNIAFGLQQPGPVDSIAFLSSKMTVFNTTSDVG